MLNPMFNVKNYVNYVKTMLISGIQGTFQGHFSQSESKNENILYT